MYAVWTINACHSARCDPMILITSFVLGAITICIVAPLVRRTIGKTTGLSVNRGKSLCVVCIFVFKVSAVCRLMLQVQRVHNCQSRNMIEIFFTI
jgi:hypothetical protein